MISRVKRSKFWRWLARGAPVLALMLVLLGSVLVQTALATDPPDPTGGDASFYMMSSIGAGYLNDTLAKVGMGTDGVTAADITQSAAGGLLGYCDALDESGVFSKWLHSQFSNSAVSFSHDTFKRLMGSSYGGSAAGVGDMAKSMYAYCKYGQLLSMLGLDMAGESGSHPIRWLVGFLMRIAYTVAIFVPRLFVMLVGILKVINPFRFFNANSNLFRISALDSNAEGNGYLSAPTDGTNVSLIATESGLAYVARVLTTVYDFMYEHMALIILTISFVILVTNLVFSANKNAFKKIKAYVMRLVVMFLVVPLCAMIYTETLDKLEDDLTVGLSYGTTRIVMSTFMDFESWASMYNLKVPASGVADLQLDTATNRPRGTTTLNLRTSCYNLNAKSWGKRRFSELIDSGVPPMAFGGSTDSFFPQQSLSSTASKTGASDAVNEFNSSARSSSLKDDNVTEMVYDLLERYQDGTFYYSSSYESEFKAQHKNDVEAILDTVEKSGKTVSEFRKNANDLIGSSSSNIVWGGSGNLCAISGSNGNIYDFSNSAGLSPMAMYNYLSSSFDEANVKVYSNEKSSSGFIRDSHFSVTLIGTSSLDQFLYFLNALALLGCVAVLGIGYAMAVIFCNIKRSFLMFPEIITTTFGSLRAGARLVGHTILLIVEVIVTILVYMVACEFLMAVNDLICTDMIRGLTATDVGGALVLGASLSAVIVVSLILSTVMLVIFVIMALKVRKTIVKTIDEAVTSLIDRLFGVQHIPEPDTPGLGGRAAGALAAGAGAGLANRMMNGDSSNQNARGTAVADDAGSDGGGGDGNGGGGNGGDGDGDGSEEATKVSEGEEAAAQADADGVEPADADSLGTDDMPSGTMSESEDSATSEDKQTAEELAESDSLDGAAVAGGAAVGAAVAGGDGGDGDDGDSGSGGSGTAPEAIKDNDSVDSNSDSESSESSETQKEVAGGADENGKSDDGDESEDGDGDSDGDDKSEGGDKNQQTKNAQPGDGNTPKKNNQNGSKHKNADGKKTGKPGDKSGSDKKDGSGDKKDDQGGDSNGDNIKNAQPGDKADASDVKKAAAIGAATGTAAAAAANAKNAQEGDKAGGGSDDKSGGSGENSGGSGDKQGGSDDKSGGDSGTKPVVENADTNGGTDKSGGSGGGSGGESSGTAPANSNNGGGNAETTPNSESDGDTDKSGGDGDKSDGDGGDDKSNGGTRNAVPNADSNGAPTAPGSRAGTKQLGGTAAQVAAAQAAAAAAAAGTVTTTPNGGAAKPGENQNGGSGENSGGGAGEKQSGGSGENSGGASTRPVANAGGENQSGGSGEKQPSGSGEKQSGGSDDKKSGGNAGGANSNNSGGNGGNSGGGNAHTKPLETTGGSGSGSGSIEHGESHGSGPSDVERSEPIPKSPDPAAPSSGGNNANTTTVSGGSGGNNQQQSGSNAGGDNQQQSGGNSGSGQQGDGVRNARSAPSGQNQQSGGNQNQQQGGGARTVRQSGGQNQQQGGQGQNRAPSGNNQNQQQGGGARTVRQSGGQNQQHGGSQGGGSGQRAQAQSGAQGGQSTVHQTQSENPAPRQQGGQSGQVVQGSPNGRRVSGPQPNSGRPSQSRVIGAAVVGSFLQSSNNKIVSEMGRGMNRVAEIEMYQNRGTQAQNRNQAQNQNRPGTNTTDTHSNTEKKELEDKATDVIRTNKKNQPPRKPPAKKKVLNINPGKVKDYGPSKKPGDKPDGDDAGKRQKPEREDPKKRPETRPDTSGGAGSNGAPPPPPGGDDDDMLF